MQPRFSNAEYQMLEEGCNLNSDVCENNVPMKNLLRINGNYPERGTAFDLQIYDVRKGAMTQKTHFEHSQVFCEDHLQILGSSSEQTQTYLSTVREDHGDDRSSPQISPEPNPHPAPRREM